MTSQNADAAVFIARVKKQSSLCRLPGPPTTHTTSIHPSPNNSLNGAWTPIILAAANPPSSLRIFEGQGMGPEHGSIADTACTTADDGRFDDLALHGMKKRKATQALNVFRRGCALAVYPFSLN
jgi:hypothetical protein